MQRGRPRLAARRRECNMNTGEKRCLDLYEPDLAKKRAPWFTRTHPKNARRTVSLGWNAALSRRLEMRELRACSNYPTDSEVRKVWGKLSLSDRPTLHTAA